MPAVPVPGGAGIQSPVEIKLKPKWRYDSSNRTFVSDSGETFRPSGSLPKGTKIVYKVPDLAKADRRGMSVDEKNLVRHLQVILPKGEQPSKYVEDIRSWTSVEEAHTAPEISLPNRV